MENMGNRKIVVGLGEILWDLLPEGRRLGGAPANFAWHAQSLGADSSMVSRIGDDQEGRDIQALLQGRGLRLDYLQLDGDRPTGTVAVRLDDAGKPTYVIHENVAWDNMTLTPEAEALARRTDAVCFGSLAQRQATSRVAIQGFIKNVPSHSLRVFDINLRQNYYNKDIIEGSLELANALKLNDEELPVVAEMLALKEGEERDQAAALIKRFDLRMVAITKGADGCVLQSARERIEQPGESPGPIADTVGAGDSFTAATVMGLLYERPLAEIARQANRLAGYVCTQRGAMPDLPDAFKSWLN